MPQLVVRSSRPAYSGLTSTEDRPCATCDHVPQRAAWSMRYLVRARIKPGKAEALLAAVRAGTLGQGSVAGDEYLHVMQQARVAADGTARWVEVCFCAIPLEEERPYWEEYFELESVADAHARRNCRHENGTEPWACGECDCTRKLEAKLAGEDEPLLQRLARG